MGLFNHKQQQPQQQSPADESAAIEQRFMDENFREELRNHGRLYFERIINENGAVFKQDLDATVAQIDTELKAQITQQFDSVITELREEFKQEVSRRLDVQFAEYSKTMKEAQDKALGTMTTSAELLQEQHLQLSVKLKKTITDQETVIGSMFEDNKSRITAMNDAQNLSLQWLNRSVQALQEQHQMLSVALQKAVANQEAMLISSFQENMAQVVDHYLMGALGDQYDIKAQLPAIVKQLEENKQAIVDDISL